MRVHLCEGCYPNTEKRPTLDVVASMPCARCGALDEYIGGTARVHYYEQGDFEILGVKDGDTIEGGVLASDGKFYTFEQWETLKAIQLATSAVMVSLDPKAPWPFPAEPLPQEK